MLTTGQVVFNCGHRMMASLDVRDWEGRIAWDLMSAMGESIAYSTGVMVRDYVPCPRCRGPLAVSRTKPRLPEQASPRRESRRPWCQSGASPRRSDPRVAYDAPIPLIGGRPQ
jgi:hypothetical protein